MKRAIRGCNRYPSIPLDGYKGGNRMLYHLDQFIHNSLGLCFWDLPTLLVGIIMIIILAVHIHSQKKRKSDFKERLKKKIKEIKEYGETQGAAAQTVAAGSIREEEPR